MPVVARSPESNARAEEGGAAAIVAEIGSLPARRRRRRHADEHHAAVLEEVLGRDVPVFCEKPLTDDPIAAERLAARAPDRLFVMDKWRYHPASWRLARSFANGGWARSRE